MICSKDRDKSRYAANPEKYRNISNNWRKNNPEKVKVAQEKWRKNNPEKVAENNRNFYATNAGRERLRAKKWRKNNPEKVKATTQRWRKSNADRFRRMKKKWNADNAAHNKTIRRYHYILHGEHSREVSRNWKRNNPHLVREANARRAAQQLQATPGWADKSAILKFYELAVQLTTATGVEHQVDHIVPLRSKIVCGLHCEANLQVLTRDENLAKGNRQWPNMP